MGGSLLYFSAPNFNSLSHKKVMKLRAQVFFNITRQVTTRRAICDTEIERNRNTHDMLHGNEEMGCRKTVACHASLCRLSLADKKKRKIIAHRTGVGAKRCNARQEMPSFLPPLL